MAFPESGTRPASAPGRAPVLAVDAALGAFFLAALLVERFMLAPGPPRPVWWRVSGSRSR